jgi:hypothetical protein
MFHHYSTLGIESKNNQMVLSQGTSSFRNFAEVYNYTHTEEQD